MMEMDYKMQISVGFKTKEILIITVPHAKCTKTNENHYCDSIAAIVAQKLYEEYRKKTNVICIESNEYRYIVDMNRKISRSSQMRKKIDEIKNKYKELGYKIKLLDIHSYPKNGFTIYPEDKMAIKPHKLEDNWMITFLYYYEKNMDGKIDRLKKKIDNLNKHNISAIGLQGSDLNDILLLFEKDDIEQYLIEFQETRIDDILNNISLIAQNV